MRVYMDISHALDFHKVHHIYIYTCKYIYTHTYMHGQTDRQTDRHAYMDIYIYIYMFAAFCSCAYNRRAYAMLPKFGALADGIAGTP